MSVHLHSRMSYHDPRTERDGLTIKEDICRVLARAGRPLTDRQVSERIGRDRPATVPKIIELLDQGIIVESRWVRCEVSDRIVRTTRLASEAEREEARERRARKRQAAWEAPKAILWVVKAAGRIGRAYANEDQAREAFDAATDPTTQLLFGELRVMADKGGNGDSIVKS